MSAETKKAPRWEILTAYFMIYVVWGSTYFFIGEAMDGFPPYVLGGLRFTAAGALLLGVAIACRENPFDFGLMRISIPCGMVMLFADMTAIMLAQRYISSSLEAVLASSTMIWITLFNYRSWRYNFRNARVPLGLVGGLLGVVLLYIHELVLPEGNGEYGVIIFLMGMLAWSIGSLFIKYRASAHENVNAWSGTAWQMLAAGLAFWAVAAATGEVQDVHWTEIPWHAWWNLGYLVLFGSILAYTSYVWLLKVRPATEVATHAYANPFIAIILGACFGNEHITLIQWLGLAIILVSLVLINGRHKHRRRSRRV